MSQFALRIPDSLAGYAKELAREDKVSLNQFIVLALAEKVSALKTEAFFLERAERANTEKALSILDSVRKLPPIAGDELPG
ncbi:MAG: toxin-antitoxin system HicB family antitoxin [Desulfuromonadaceae bacterium]|nr:toxin-antitoxin system HicB family antitoxin [Desulfuromonadaceae bacterium]MDD5106562.1 toxin-antitoxin system HicB family antitoxin [Desulfuromonadaceae bacterium]